MAAVCVICGPSGCGKSTFGKAVAAAVPATAVLKDADDFHPAANIAKMRAGVPLTDEDRLPWLLALRAEIQKHAASGQRLVLACSALKEVYRQLLAGRCNSLGDSEVPGRFTSGSVGDTEEVAFVLLLPPREVLARRLAARQAAGTHFMPAALLDSQLAALEVGNRRDWLLVVDDDRGFPEAVNAIVRAWVGGGAGW